MIIEYVSSSGLPKGFRIAQYTVKELQDLLAADPGLWERVVYNINLYCRQKDCLVDGRAKLSERVAADFKFPMKTKKVTVDGEEKTVPDETDNEFVDRFVASAVAGKVTVPGFTKTGNAEQDEASVYTLLQGVADSLGTTQADAKAFLSVENEAGIMVLTKEPAPNYFTVDFRAAERKAGKPKKLPEYAINGAKNIIANKSQATWVKRFKEGYTNKEGFKIVPIVHKPFDTVPEKGATPEQIAAVEATNVANLAEAVWEAEAQARKQREANTTKEFA